MALIVYITAVVLAALSAGVTAWFVAAPFVLLALVVLLRYELRLLTQKARNAGSLVPISGSKVPAPRAIPDD